jgi:hypothetical protein
MPLAINPDVTPATIHQTICVSGWTKTVRPSTSYTNRIKRDLAPGEDIGDYELDHRVPIELGGAPRDEANLWMQPWEGSCGARKKDRLETHLKREVCAGRISLRQAQAEIGGDWVVSYNARIGHLVCD